MDPTLNMTNSFPMKYPVTNIIFPNKTLILFSKRHSSSSSQQMALLAGMAFIGGVVAGLLIRCIYNGIVKYFMSNMDRIATSQRRSRGNVNPSFVDDSFRHANDEPPDYVTVTEVSTISGGTKPTDVRKESKISEEVPPAYISVVSDVTRVSRSATT